MSEERDFEDRFAELRSQYADRVCERIAEIERVAAALREEFHGELFDELYQSVHRLSGSGETMGFPKLSELSIALEERLESAEPSERAEWLEQVEIYCRRVRGMFDES